MNITPSTQPITPPTPNPQTVGGTFDDGITMNSPIAMGGQPPNPAFWAERRELMDVVQLNNQMPVGTVIFNLDVLRFAGNERNNPETMTTHATIGPGQPAYCMMIPRHILFSSAQYLSLTVKFDFWAITPIASPLPDAEGNMASPTSCKIRLSYRPATRKRWASSTLTADDESDQNADTLFRENMWEWDIKKQTQFSIELQGNIPTKLMPTTIPNYDNVLSLEPRDIYPFFQSTFGSLKATILNPYIPGSIYPDSCEICIFKSTPNLQCFVKRGYINRLCYTAI